jgi:hypothetical protein
LGTAVQLKGTKTFVRRDEMAWMARATSSLPVPDSPVTKTVTSEERILCTSSTSCVIAGEEWMNPGMKLSRACADCSGRS